MGAQQSAAAQAATSGQEIDRAYQEVMLHGNSLVTQATRAGWLAGNTQALCARIAIIERNMFDWLDLEQLAGIQGRLGITLQPYGMAFTQAQEANARRRACAVIADYFTIKVRLAAYIRQNMRALCEDARDEIARNMPAMLQGATTAQQSQAYGRLKRLDNLLVRWYQRVARLLTSLEGDIPIDRVRQIESEAQRMLTSGYSECCQAVHDLRDFAWEPLDPGPGFVNRYLPGEPIVGVLPRIAVTGLAGPAQPGTAACGRQIDLSQADLSSAVL
ncbi:hypothetical protein psal_cds_243 [Pandoravirus salinus]|uniref:Uncharacterized protein n=1 Tax=Pandoravirus salinus TaxID=1349410 RepID=S4VWH4_9VIRU|nr:hypothetical protein psal_cds_243 [Pandoravirus salinus]AGO83791.1 hypothetical protein psal_cds_243 [Pandoravirus salinus]